MPPEATDLSDERRRESITRFKYDIFVLFVIDCMLWLCCNLYDHLSGYDHPVGIHYSARFIRLFTLSGLILFQLTLFKLARLWINRYGTKFHEEFQGVVYFSMFSAIIYFELSMFAVAYTYLGITDTATHVLVQDFKTTLYFSMITFTTIGYGDFVPTPAARSMASAEGFIGYLNLAIIIAATVSSLTENRRRPKDDIEQ